MSTSQADLTILIVDDSRLDLALMSAMLGKMGYESLQANSGEAALEIFRLRQPDMVLIDVTMPGMGGYQAVREIRQVLCDAWIPIIFVTELDHEDDIVRGIEVGGDDFVLKPVNFKLLQTKIKSLHKHLLLFREIGNQKALLRDYQVKNEEEQQTAQEFMGRLLALDKLKDPLVQFHLQAAEVFSGDLIAAARSPAGHLYAILADSTGHGLTAALAVMPVLQSFHAMVAKGYSISALAAEINRKIREYLPANRFVAALLVALDAKDGRVSVWNGGCPPAVLLDSEGTVVCQFDSMHLPLGILNPNSFDEEVTHYYYGNRHCQLVLCSDGAVDSLEPGSMEVGMSHLMSAARSGKVEERLQNMLNMVEQKLAGKPAHDDIALILLDCPAESRGELPIPEQPELTRREARLTDVDMGQQQEMKSEWQFALTLTAPQLRQADIVPLLLHVVSQIELDGASLSGKLFLILSELFNNALDHGLLKLDSTLKHDAQGMDRYFEERAIRLKQLEHGEINLSLQKISSGRGSCLNIVVKDTGDGFDYQTLHSTALEASTRRHGRGIALVESLSSQLYYADNGRESHASICLLNP